MARQIPWDDIPEPSSSFPVGIAHLFNIEELEIIESSTGKAMVKATLRCLEPSPGQVCYENFTIGNDDDPEGKDPSQLQKNYSMQLLTKLLKQAKAKLEGSLEKVLEKAQGRHVGIVFKTEIDKRSGEPRSRPGTYFTEGEMAPGTDVAKAGGVPKGAQPPKKAKPVEAEGDDEPEAKPVKKSKPAVVDYDEE
jgi:hypothetical protein